MVNPCMIQIPLGLDPEALRISEQFQSLFDAVIIDEQLYAAGSAFHPGADADNDGAYAGSVQRDPRHIRFYPIRIGLDGFHR
jgi:hypothetical protein